MSDEASAEEARETGGQPRCTIWTPDGLRETVGPLPDIGLGIALIFTVSFQQRRGMVSPVSLMAMKSAPEGSTLDVRPPCPTAASSSCMAALPSTGRVLSGGTRYSPRRQSRAHGRLASSAEASSDMACSLCVDQRDNQSCAANGSDYWRSCGPDPSRNAEHQRPTLPSLKAGWAVGW
jgi:hypothetical protein